MSGISVIAAVLNDREGTQELLDGLAAQSRPPDEVVVADGGSTDGTLELLETSKGGPFPLVVLRVPGTNIAGARNLAVEAASHEWIACTDAGCRPTTGWLEAIDRARAGADFVTGIATCRAETEFERIAALTHYPDPEELAAPGALVRLSHVLFGRRYRATRPGGGSMAFSKAAWRSVGGFPEHVHTGEDHAYGHRVELEGGRAVLEEGARVTWRPPPDWRATARMFFSYCRGDIRTPRRTRHLARLAAWVAGPLLAVAGSGRGRVVVLTGGAAYVALPVRRALAAGVRPVALWRIPALVALKDLSQLAGAAAGILDAARGQPQPNPLRGTRPAAVLGWDSAPGDGSAHSRAARAG